MWYCLPGGLPSPTSTLATRTRFPIVIDITPWAAWGLAGVPLAAGGEDVPQRHGLVGHDAIHPEVEQVLHVGPLVDGPDMNLEPERLGAVDEGRGGHGDGHLDTADSGAGQPVHDQAGALPGMGPQPPGPLRVVPSPC